MKLKLNELTGEEQSFQWPIDKDWIAEMLKQNAEDDDLEAGLFSEDGPFQLKVWVYRTDDEVFFRANLEGQVKGTCVRCLEPVDVSVDTEFGGLFCPQRGAAADEPDDPSHFFYQGEEINFSGALQEHVFLNLPLNPTCDQELGACNGDLLKQQFANTDEFEEEKPKVDKRWDALRQIKESLAQKK